MNHTKPTEQKQLEGNRGKRPLDASSDMTLPAGAPPMPRGLNPDARQHWRWLVGVLTKARVLTVGDFGILLVAVNTYAQMMKLERAVVRMKKFSYKEKGSMGQTMQKGYIELEQLGNVRKQYIRAISELGLTPVSRNRVKKVPIESKTGAAAYFT